MPLSPEQLAARKHVIGASEVAAVLGINPFKTAFEVYAEKVDDLEPFEGNRYTDAGNRFEPEVLNWAEEQLGDLERNVTVRFGGAPIASTCDALLVGRRNPVEAKTAGLFGPLSDEWGDDGTDAVPAQYLVQLQAQMLCTESDMAYLAAFLGGRGFAMFKVHRSDKVCKYLASYLPEWWDRHVVKRVPPPMGNTSLEVLKRLRREPNKTIEVAPQLVADFEQAKAAATAADKAKDAAQKALLAEMGDAEAAEFGDPSKVLTFYEQTRKAHHVSESTFRVLRVSKRS